VQLYLTFEGRSGIMLRRPGALYGDDQLSPQSIQFHTTKQVTLNWLSYLAKTFTKGNVPPHIKESWFQTASLTAGKTCSSKEEGSTLYY
jgi:hypothetical protein